MKNRFKSQARTPYDVQVEILRVEKLLKRITKDKSLPTFVNFFIHCVISGNAESVNLKLMYPKLYSDVRNWIMSHTDNVNAFRASGKSK